MKENRFIYILLAVSLLIGLSTITDFGESWDDYSLQKYADYSLRTYNTWRTQGIMPITSEDLGNYGPSFVMTVALGSRFLNSLLPLNPSDSRHIIYFITFLIGIWAFYEIGKRWLTHNATMYATLLFATQPLFWGHAFMNPKDTPFLAFFLLSLLFGFRMVDSYDTIVQTAPIPRWLRNVTMFGIAIIFGLFVSTQLIHAWIDSLVRAASSGETNLISAIASDLHKVKPEVYIQRYFIFFLWFRSFLFLLFSFLSLSAVRYYSPTSYRSLISIILPAFLLGFTASIRILGPFAGIIVAVYAFRKYRKRALSPLVSYTLIAITTMYITWPYLWSDPIGHVIESLQTMSKYPWYGTVHFNGMEYAPIDLPYTYLPVLLAIQFTEPIWVLFIIGIAGAIKRYQDKLELLGLTGIWFVLPLIGFIVMNVALYDNFRQIFFILPPVFFMAGLGMDSILKRVDRPILQILIIVLLILPGLMAGIRLHPYEYVYYNTLANDPNERFELDYWAISYRQASEYVNTVASANTNILAIGPGQVVALYIREDLTVLSDDEEITEPFDYVIITTRYNSDVVMYPEAATVYKIERNGMLFTVVKKIDR